MPRLVTIKVDVNQKYLDKAAELRRLYDKYGVKVFEFLGSRAPGRPRS